MPDTSIPIETQLNFVRGARHLVAKKKKVVVDGTHSEILMAIEARLLRAKIQEESQKDINQPATLGQEGNDYQLSN